MHSMCVMREASSFCVNDLLRNHRVCSEFLLSEDMIVCVRLRLIMEENKLRGCCMLKPMLFRH